MHERYCFESDPSSFSGITWWWLITTWIWVNLFHRTRKLSINTPWGNLENLVVESIRREKFLDTSDWLIEGYFQHNQAVWFSIDWCFETGEEPMGNFVEHAFLDALLDGFAQEHDILPPEEYSTETVAGIKMSELTADRLKDVAGIVVAGESYEELHVQVSLYAAGQDQHIRAQLQELNAKGSLSILESEYTRCDANGDQVQAFQLKDMGGWSLYTVVNAITEKLPEATYDIVLSWDIDDRAA